MTNELEIRPYTAADGVAMMTNLVGKSKVSSDTCKWCTEAERDGMAFTVIYKGTMVACAGIVKEREGVGLAWALYPPDIGKHHIDPRITRDKLRELMAEHNFWRIEATVRCDFPTGASYLRWMGFEKEGRMKQNEPDRTDSFLYAIVDECKRCGKCCYKAYFDEKGNITKTTTKCHHLTKDNLCSVYGHRPDWCMTAEQMAELNLLPDGCGYQGDK